MPSQKKVGEVSYGYSTDINVLEEENRFLRESIGTLEAELEKFRRSPLISCEIKDLIEDKVIIRLPNGNEFMVDMAEK